MLPPFARVAKEVKLFCTPVPPISPEPMLFISALDNAVFVFAVAMSACAALKQLCAAAALVGSPLSIVMVGVGMAVPP